MKFLNIEEQVLKNAQDIKTLKSGIKIELYCNSLADLSTVTTEENVGKYALVSILLAKRLYLITRRTNGEIEAVDLGLFPAVVTGATGEKGETGETGKDGTGIYGCTATLPPVDSYKEGDFYILYNGDVYKKISNHWIRQTNIKGAQGPVGLNGTVVIPNPVEAYTDELRKIAIDGTVYEIENPYKYLITFDGNGVHFEALEDYKNYIFEWDVKVESTHLLKLDSIEQLTNYQGEPYFTTEEYDAIKFSSQLFAPYNITYARALKDILIPAGKTLNLNSIDQIVNSGNGDPLLARYEHIVRVFRDTLNGYQSGCCLLFSFINNSSDPIDAAKFIDLMGIDGRTEVLHGGSYGITPENAKTYLAYAKIDSLNYPNTLPVYYFRLNEDGSTDKDFFNDFTLDTLTVEEISNKRIL